MLAARNLDWTRKPARRESRVDVLRGVALLCIYVDHIPRDILNWVTLRDFGFSDAAELFVMLAGFASMMAYGRSFARDGARMGLRRIVLRCVRLYVFQVGLLLLTVGIVWLWTHQYNEEPHTLGPMIHGGVRALVPGLTLRSQPSNLNILPLYIVLLALFPLIYAGLRRSVALTLLVSVAIWAVSNHYPTLNFTNAFDGNFWFFSPLAWQLLFVLGAVLAVIMAGNGGNLPRWPWLVALCLAFLTFAAVQTFPWTAFGLPNLAPVPMEPPDKTQLAPLRLLHALALVYVALSWSGWSGTNRSLLLRGLEVCGRHSLEVFSLGTVLALIARLAFRTYDIGWEMQVIVNVVGIGGMVGLAVLLERGRRQPAPRAASRPAPGRILANPG
jgi:hypothetical protein